MTKKIEFELDVCPFCGADANVIETDDGGMAVFYVRCNRNSCSAQGPKRGTSSGASKAWNKAQGGFRRV